MVSIAGVGGGTKLDAQHCEVRVLSRFIEATVEIRSQVVGGVVRDNTEWFPKPLATAEVSARCSREGFHGGGAFTPDVEDAWTETYNTLAEVMKSAAYAHVDGILPTRILGRCCAQNARFARFRGGGCLRRIKPALRSTFDRHIADRHAVLHREAADNIVAAGFSTVQKSCLAGPASRPAAQWFKWSVTSSPI